VNENYTEHTSQQLSKTLYTDKVFDTEKNNVLNLVNCPKTTDAAKIQFDHVLSETL
jgi:hypothetical protein